METWICQHYSGGHSRTICSSAILLWYRILLIQIIRDLIDINETNRAIPSFLHLYIT